MAKVTDFELGGKFGRGSRLFAGKSVAKNRFGGSLHWSTRLHLPCWGKCGCLGANSGSWTNAVCTFGTGGSIWITMK